MTRSCQGPSVAHDDDKAPKGVLKSVLRQIPPGKVQLATLYSVLS